jgi:hypothetical protein
MATLKTNLTTNWAKVARTNENHVSLWNKFTVFADSQHERKAMWYFLALAVQGIFFLPLPAFLMYYYNASIIVLLITLTCFLPALLLVWAVQVSGPSCFYRQQAY